MSFWRVLSGVWPPMLATLALSGCATHELWQGREEYVEFVIHDGRDPESILKAEGVSYYCQGLVYSTLNLSKVCYVKQDNVMGLKGFALRVVKTPVALAIDTGTVALGVILVVGTVYTNGCSSGGGCSR
jgi:hypothetical protein